jgi:polyphosphate kinase 2 (PPK2 family)
VPDLAAVDPQDRAGLPLPKRKVKAATAADIAEIVRLQEILYAQAQHAVLVVLQGTDTSGKDGTIRHVFAPINPQGIITTSFKMPTPPELAHDFLWRIHNAVPPVGMIGVFNRRHGLGHSALVGGRYGRPCLALSAQVMP